MAPLPPYLPRLMAAPRLPANARIEPELAVSIALAHRLRAATLEGLFRGVWFHVPNEGSGGRSGAERGQLRARIQGAKQRVAGVIKGVADFVLIWPVAGGLDAGAIELKAGSGRLTEAQRDFLTWVAAAGGRTAVHDDAARAWETLIEWGAIVAPRAARPTPAPLARAPVLTLVPSEGQP